MQLTIITINLKYPQQNIKLFCIEPYGFACVP